MAATSTSRKSSEGSGKRRSIPVLGIVFGVIVVILVAVVLFGTSEPGSEYGDPQVDGLLPPMPNAPVDNSATGMAIPTVSGQDFDGNEVAITDDGRAKGIVFLAHWCSHCQAEVPRVQAWLDGTGGMDGVDIYSVSTSMSSSRDNYPPSEWLESEGWTSPVIRDDNDDTVVRSFGGGGYPFWVFVNADGTVALRTSGELSAEQLEQALGALETG